VDLGDVEQAEKMLAEAERSRSTRQRDKRRAEDLVKEARKALEFQRLSQARERIAEALKLDPPNKAASGVQQKIADLERRVALAETCGMIANAISSARFEEAAKKLDAAEGEFGKNSDLAGLRGRLAEGREEQREKTVAEAARGVEAAIRAGQLDEAEKKLKTAVNEFGKEPRFDKLRREIQKSHEQLKQREIERATSEVEKLLRSAKVDDAQRSLDAAITAHGPQSAFDRLRSRITETRRELEHRNAVAQEVTSIEGLLTQGKLDRAGKQLEIAMSLYGEDPDFVTLRSKLDAAIDEHEHKLAQQRAENERGQARKREEKERQRVRAEQERKQAEAAQQRDEQQRLEARKREEHQKATKKATKKPPKTSIQEVIGPDSVQIRNLRKQLDEKKKEQTRQARKRTRHSAPPDDAPVDQTVLLPSRKTAQAAAPAARRGPLIGIAVAATVIVIAVAGYFLWPTPSDDPDIPIVPVASVSVTGSLVLDAWPWAEITSIVDSDGAAVAVAAATFTPVHLSLEPGSYTVSLSHGDQPKQQVQIEIRPSETTETRVRFAAPDADAYFKQQGW
jgi:hypothetical protein